MLIMMRKVPESEWSVTSNMYIFQQIYFDFRSYKEIEA